MTIKRSTIEQRIKRGMTRENAESMPLQVVRVLTMDKVLDIEKEGLSINSSAYVLGVTAPALSAYIKRHKLSWRGKQAEIQKRERFVISQAKQCLASGVSESAVYAQMKRNGLSFSDALEKVIKSKNNKTTMSQCQSDFIMQNYKGMGCKAVAEKLAMPMLRVKCRYNYVLRKKMLHNRLDGCRA